MKGTLFSADFIEESNGNLRLLELNTDTAVSDSALAYVDFSGFINLLSESSISEVHIISKSWHSNLVAKLSQSLHDSAPFVTTFENILEEDTTIYPTSIEDSESKFILRMAYDESAIFDSEYAKNKLNPLKLFTDGGDSGSIAEYYVSSSTDGVSDFLPNDFNTSNIPDVISKNLNRSVSTPLSFYKLGKSSETAENRYSEFKSTFEENSLLIKFYENSSESKVKSIRSMNVIYGGNLDILNLGNHVSEGLFDKPVSIETDDNVINNQVDIKHYYELTTSFPRFSNIYNWGGIFEEEEIVKSDGTSVLISEAAIGDSFKSYYIEGSPNTDVVSEFMAWSHPGSELPSGSYATSSVLINNIEQPLTYNLVFHITLEDNSDFRAAGGSHMLVYDSTLDVIRYEDTYNLDTTKHKLINLSGGVVNIQSIVMEVLDGNYSAHVLDMESTDTYFLSNGELSVKIVTHNCFPAGTKITLADGTQKNIEELTINDKLLTWNEHNGDLVEGTIGNIVKKSENLLIHLTTTEGEIKSTAFHKFYVRGKRWTSAQDIVIGDVLVNKEGNDVLVTDRKDILGDVEVYHILDVKDNHTYFAENILVHNYKGYICFVAGTEITLANGDVKNIEDVLVGDSVLTYNEETKQNEVGVVGNTYKGDVVRVIELHFSNGVKISTTHEHPFYVVDKGWVTASKLEIGDNCIDTNGNEVGISDKQEKEESHTVYNLLDVSSNHNFYANGILVHNKL